MINSGHSVASTRITLVHGVVKFLELVRLSKLPVTDDCHRPLHCDKGFKRFERKLKKLMSKAGWYDLDQAVFLQKLRWRCNLPVEWRGSKPIQQKVYGMSFTTVIKVPGTKGSRLLRKLSKIEPRVAKSSGYQCKIVEESGKPLSYSFSKNIGCDKCPRPDCHVCQNPTLKGPSCVE